MPHPADVQRQLGERAASLRAQPLDRLLDEALGDGEEERISTSVARRALAMIDGERHQRGAEIDGDHRRHHLPAQRAPPPQAEAGFADEGAHGVVPSGAAVSTARTGSARSAAKAASREAPWLRRLK